MTADKKDKRKAPKISPERKKAMFPGRELR